MHTYIHTYIHTYYATFLSENCKKPTVKRYKKRTDPHVRDRLLTEGAEDSRPSSPNGWGSRVQGSGFRA